MDWDGPRYQVASVTAFGVVALKLSWPYIVRGWYLLGFRLGRLARKVAASQQSRRPAE